MGAGETPQPFSQKEVEEIGCTTSSATARPYGVKLVCRTWEQPRSSYYFFEVKDSSRQIEVIAIRPRGRAYSKN